MSLMQFMETIPVLLPKLQMRHSELICSLTVRRYGETQLVIVLTCLEVRGHTGEHDKLV